MADCTAAGAGAMHNAPNLEVNDFCLGNRVLTYFKVSCKPRSAVSLSMSVCLSDFSTIIDQPVSRGSLRMFLGLQLDAEQLSLANFSSSSAALPCSSACNKHQHAALDTIATRHHICQFRCLSNVTAASHLLHSSCSPDASLCAATGPSS